MGDNEVAAVGSMSQDEKFDSASSKKEVNHWKKNLEQKSSEVSSSPRIGLDHFMQEPVGTERNLHIADHEIVLSRLMFEKWGSPRHDLIFDKLSESEKLLRDVEMIIRGAIRDCHRGAPCFAITSTCCCN